MPRKAKTEATQTIGQKSPSVQTALPSSVLSSPDDISTIKGNITPEQEQRLVDVLMSLDVSDRVVLSSAIGNIVSVRLATELKVIQGIGVGLLSENITVENATYLLAKQKDSLKDLVDLKDRIDGVSDAPNRKDMNIVIIRDNCDIRYRFADKGDSLGSSIETISRQISVQ